MKFISHEAELVFFIGAGTGAIASLHESNKWLLGWAAIILAIQIPLLAAMVTGLSLIHVDWVAPQLN